MESGADYHTMATDLLNAGIGDVGRLQFIIECITSQKPLYNTDEKYLRQKHGELEAKIKALSSTKKPKPRVSESDLDDIVNKALETKRQPPRRTKRQKPFIKRLFGR